MFIGSSGRRVACKAAATVLGAVHHAELRITERPAGAWLQHLRDAFQSGPNRVSSEGSLLRVRFLEPVRIPVFESLLPSVQSTCSRRILELITRTLLLEILLLHHFHLTARRQLCVARRLLSRLFPDFIRRPFLRRSAMSP